MLISSTGTLVRTAVDEISVLGRNTQGVRLIRLGEGERLVGIERDREPGGERRGRGPEMPTVTGRRGARRGPGRHAGVPDSRARRRYAGWYSPLQCRSGKRTLRARIQFRRGPRHAAAGSSRTGPGRADRLARQRHVGHGSQPSRQGLRRPWRTEAEALTARAARRAGGLQGAVPAGRRHRPVRRHPAEPRRADSTADYVNTGAWSKKAIGEAKRYCKVNVAADEAALELHHRPAARGAAAHARRRLRALHAE